MQRTGHSPTGILVASLALALAGLVAGCDAPDGGDDPGVDFDAGGGTGGFDPRRAACVGCDDGPGCEGDEDCDRGVCHPTLAVCVQCVDDADCPEGVCLGSAAVCVQCYQDAHCPGGVCDPASETCVECTEDAHCESGFCNEATGGCVGCGSDADCDDGDPCTLDTCAGAGCGHAPGPDGVGCDDGDPCTEGESCAAGACGGGAPVGGAGCCEAHACEEGTPYDSDGDGCEDACEPEPCDPFTCEEGTPYDSDGDGCEDACEPEPCDPFTCEEGIPYDSDGDGCEDACHPCVPLFCPPGTVPEDSDGDGCADRCECPGGVCPCDSTIVCALGSQGYDFNGDGCADACVCAADGVVVAPGEPCPCAWEVTCAGGTHPADGDGDGCDDACLCAGGVAPGPDGFCGCANELSCAAGTLPLDLDADACPDVCLCPGGAAPSADGLCGCPHTLACVSGTNALDTTGDGCADTCVAQCKTTCDCYELGLAFAEPCAGELPTTGNAWSCAEGQCVTTCGPVPEDALLCLACPDPPACGLGQTVVDTDDDGCGDACQCILAGVAVPPGALCACPFELLCAAGTEPFDKDGDGCGDLCLCPGGAPPGATGQCCEDTAVCPPGAKPVDKDGDGCRESCLCGDGSYLTVVDALSCPCLVALTCPVGTEGLDQDGDGCPDICVCPDGSKPNALGACCGTVEAVCLASLVAVDADGDGCYDACVCLDGTQPTDAGCGCPLAVVCPEPSKAVDTDEDGCPDACLCPDGNKPVGADGVCCEKAALACLQGTAAVDQDGDGCPDTCLCPSGVAPGAEGTCCNLALDCPGGQEPGDLDGDGCPDACVCAEDSGALPDFFAGCCPEKVVCEVGLVPVDSDGDGCEDACECLAPAAITAGTDAPIAALECCEALDCPKDTWATDADGDGCPESCLCAEGLKPVSVSDADVTAEPFVCCKPLPCPKGAAPVDEDGDGCPDVCVATACTADLGCPAGAWCEREPGACEAAGKCTTYPDACAGLWEPVCGCDGKTWGSPCEAAIAGVSVATEGECPSLCLPLACLGGEALDTDGDDCPDLCMLQPCEAISCDATADETIDSDGDACPDLCGPPCKEQGECAGDELCQRSAGHCDEPGVCAPAPQGCGGVFDPVCGCDGKTWSSACEAAAAYLSVAHLGACQDVCLGVACPPDAKAMDTDGDGCPDECVTACAVAADCEADSYCYREQGDCDGAGWCHPKPDGCAAFYDPVCGCDGELHSNACQAAAAGVSLAELEACAAPCEIAIDCAAATLAADTDGDGCPDTCLTPCKGATDCKEDHYCARPKGHCDAEGTCEAKPVGCPDVVEPVCGCDGATWSNGCDASAAGVSVAHGGACDVQVVCVGKVCPDGSEGLDTSGDGCPDTCAVPCQSACDCYAAPVELATPCLALCPTCDAYWACEQAVCVEACGPVPAEIGKCLAEPTTDTGP